MLSTYPAVFFKKKSGAYSVEFPDLNYISIDGKDLKEVSEKAVDCLARHLYMLKMSGENIPYPTTVDRIESENKYRDEYDFVNIQYVSVDVEAYAEANFNKKVRKSVSIPAWVDEEAKDLGINFSEVLDLALKSVIKGVAQSKDNSLCNDEKKIAASTIAEGVANVAGTAVAAAVASKIPILGAVACVLPSMIIKNSKK